MPYKDHAKQLQYMKNYAAKDRSLIKRRKKLGSSGKYRSMVREWTVNKKATHQGVVVDYQKKILSYDKERYWVRFETIEKLYIFSIISKEYKETTK